MHLITFINYSNQIPIILGMLGKDNLEYQSNFDQRDFEISKTQIYYHPKLDTKIVFFTDKSSFLNTPNEFFNQYDKKLIFIEELYAQLVHKKFEQIENAKKCFIWHYAEVFEKSFIEQIKNLNYDTIISGSKREELEKDENFRLDLFLPFRYFRYYIGYSYLEDLVNNITVPKYNKNKPKLFSYIRTGKDNSWRKEIIDVITDKTILDSKNSANDGYDLLYPKYKHFEAINDYLYCNFNLVFETIDYRNNNEYFITEKTFKALFFGKPIFLIAPYPVLKYLKDNGFYLLNFDFQSEINSAEDVLNGFSKFLYWLKMQNTSMLENDYNLFLNKSMKNKTTLMNILNDYSEYENIFQRLINQ